VDGDFTLTRRLALWLALSLVIHAALAGAAVAVLHVVSPAMLFIDLVHDLITAGELVATSQSPGASGSTPASALRPAPPARGPRSTPRRPAPPNPAPPAPATPAAPVAEPPREVPAREIIADPVPTPAPAAVQPQPPPPPPAARVVDPPPSPTEAGGGDAASRSTTESHASAAVPVHGGASGVGASSSGPAGGGRGGSSDGMASGQGAREGAPVALAIPGEGGSGQGAEYAAYYALLRRRVGESLTYPPAARRRGLSGTVHLDLVIQPSGIISGVEVVTSSSHRVLDEAAVEAVRDLGRLPFPGDLKPRLLRVRLPVVFDLR
jgi:protein TonB